MDKSHPHRDDPVSHHYHDTSAEDSLRARGEYRAVPSGKGGHWATMRRCDKVRDMGVLRPLRAGGARVSLISQGTQGAC